jgi:CheY-like chemotaxis protein
MKRALIIEDEPSIQEILEEILTSECGVTEVVKANDGLEGYFHAMSGEFDIITLDQMMPFCHGTELLMALRSKTGPNQNTPILFISAYIPQIPAENKQAENTLFIEKPIDISRLVRYVKMYLAKK